MNLEREKQLAQDETTASEILASLAKSPDALVRKSVAQNPNTPVEVLLNICFEFPDEVINNHIIPLLILEDPQILTCRIPINLNFAEIKKLTDIEIKRLRWTKKQCIEHLHKNFGKRSRLHLTDNQILSYLDILSLRGDNEFKKKEINGFSTGRLQEILTQSK